METKKQVSEFSVSVTADHEQYWQGHGIACTRWDDCASGCGSSIREAFDDALESLAQNGIEISAETEAKMLAELSDGLKIDLDDDIVSVQCDNQGEHTLECETCRGTGKVSLEPEEDDLTSSDGLTWYQSGKLVLTITEDDDRNEALKAYMDESQFWPNAWIISDHGNTVSVFGDESPECDCAECDGAGNLPDDDPDCAVCAGDWHFYVSIDVSLA